VRGKDGISRYEIDSDVAILLRKFFAPYNQRLFTLLGRELPWE